MGVELAAGGPDLGRGGPLPRRSAPAANREDDGRTWTSPYRLARDLTLFAAAAAGVQAIDTVFVNFRDEEGLRQECRAAARDGFTGKMAIHPNQVAVDQRGFHAERGGGGAAPGDRARCSPTTRDAGALTYRGQMVDKAHVARAERILARAKAAGQ